MRRNGAALALMLATAASARGQGKVDLLIVRDTDSKLEGAGRDGRQIWDAFQQGIRDPWLLRSAAFEGDQARPARILDHCRDLPADPDDALPFSYSGHGAIDPDAGQALTTGQGVPLLRELREAMEARKPRLIVILTDCCSDYAVRPPRPGPNPALAGNAGNAAIGAPPPITPLLRQLFLEHRGTVCITAAGTGQPAWGGKQSGGYFTSSLAANLQVKGPGPFDRNRDGFAAWDEVFPAIRSDTQPIYRAFRQEVLDRAIPSTSRMIRDVTIRVDQTPTAEIRAARVGLATDRAGVPDPHINSLADSHVPEWDRVGTHDARPARCRRADSGAAELPVRGGGAGRW
ncbi:MAG: caspase family protein [Isosphaeraceae bacterium]